MNNVINSLVEAVSQIRMDKLEIRQQKESSSMLIIIFTALFFILVSAIGYSNYRTAVTRISTLSASGRSATSATASSKHGHEA